MVSKRHKLVLWGVITILGPFMMIEAATAESVVTAILKPTNNTLPPPYLNPDSNDDGYIAISARIETPDELACVTPTNAGGTDNYFTSRSLEVTIFAIVEGFLGVDPKQAIPLVSFKWNDKNGKYCTSPFVLPIALVPNHRFGLTGPTGSPYPRITLKLVYTSKEEEQISSLVNAWIGIAGSIATGGATSTVVGLSSIASNKAISSLNEIYNNRKHSISDQTYSIPFKWNELYNAGPSVKTISFIETDIQGGFFDSESVEAAIARVRRAPDKNNVKPIFDVKLRFEYRRSLFVDDADVGGANFLPSNTGQLNSDRILNFPNGQSASTEIFPNLLQVLNSRSPSIVGALRTDSGVKCYSVFSVLRAIGLNKLDRALVINALLDESRDKWRAQPQFYTNCFARESDALKIISEIHGSLAEQPVIAGDLDAVPIEPKFSAALEPINKELLERVSEITESFTTRTNSEIRKIGIGNSLKSKTKMSWSYALAPNVNTLEEQISSLSSMEFITMSCFHQFPTDGKNRAVSVALISNNTSGKTELKPYVISMEFSDSPIYEVTSMIIQSVTNNPAAKSRFDFLKKVNYPVNSSCKQALAMAN